MPSLQSFSFVLASSLLLAGSAGIVAAEQTKGFGANPELPAQQQSLIPTVNIAPAIGWQPGEKPNAASGLAVSAFASDLDHPRWLYVLPNGDVLVAETNAPQRPDDSKGLKNWIMGFFMKRAGAGVSSPNRIVLLRSNSDASVVEKFNFLDGLNSPFGMALVGTSLYVANTDALVKFDYHDGDTKISSSGVKVVELPGGPLNHHWTKNVIANKDGSLLYVTVGSNSNVAENGLDKEENRAAILEINPKAETSRVFASGLRNPNGLAWEPATSTLFTVVNERDELGNDLVPDYLTSVKDGAFYGWPFSYYGRHIDERAKLAHPEMVEKAIAPDYALGAHTAALGLTFSSGNALPDTFKHGAFVGLHGSWNRKPPSGYKVIFVPFVNGKPSGDPIDVLTGFLSKSGEAQGRPVGVAMSSDGALLVADDVGNRIWRVSVDKHTSSFDPKR